MRWPSACLLLALSVVCLPGCGGGDSSGGVADSGDAAGMPSSSPDGAAGMMPAGGMSAPGSMEGAMGAPGGGMSPAGDSSSAGAGDPGQSGPMAGMSPPGMGPPGMDPTSAGAGDPTQAYAAGEGASSAPAYAGNPGAEGMPAMGPYGPAYTGTGDPAAAGTMPGGPPGMMPPPGLAGNPGSSAPGAIAPGAALTPGADPAYAAGEGAPPGIAMPDGASGYGPAGAAGYGPAGAPGYGPAGAGMPGSNPATPTAPREEYAEGFKGDAQRAFKAGDELAAIRYLYAYAVTSEAGAGELLPTMGWVGGMKRPMLAVRYGMGVDFTGPDNLADLKPIGSTQQVPARSDRRRQGGGNDGGGAPGGPVGPDMAGPGAMGGLEGMAGLGGAGAAIAAAATNPELAKFAGDFGSQMLSAFVTRSQGGQFGKVLQDAGRFSTAGVAGALGGAAGMPGASGYAVPGSASGGAEGAAAAGLGMPAMPSTPDGVGGPGLAGGAAAGIGGYPNLAGGALAAVTGGLNLAPGLTFVGIGSRKQLQQKALDKGLDVLVVLEVTVKQNPRLNVVTNDSEVALYDVRKGTRLVATKPLNNIAVQVKRAEKKDDGIQAEIQTLTDYLDDNLVIAELPAVLNDTAKAQPIIAGRVNALVAAKPENPLETLVEIRFWNERGLLDDASLLAAFTQLVGEETAKALTSESEEERKLAVEKWLPPKRS